MYVFQMRTLNFTYTSTQPAYHGMAIFPAVLYSTLVPPGLGTWYRYLYQVQVQVQVGGGMEVACTCPRMTYLCDAKNHNNKNHHKNSGSYDQGRREKKPISSIDQYYCNSQTHHCYQYIGLCTGSHSEDEHKRQSWHSHLRIVTSSFTTLVAVLDGHMSSRLDFRL